MTKHGQNRRIIDESCDHLALKSWLFFYRLANMWRIGDYLATVWWTNGEFGDYYLNIRRRSSEKVFLFSPNSPQIVENCSPNCPINCQIFCVRVWVFCNLQYPCRHILSCASVWLAMNSVRAAQFKAETENHGGSPISSPLHSDKGQIWYLARRTVDTVTACQWVSLYSLYRYWWLMNSISYLQHVGLSPDLWN